MPLPEPCEPELYKAEDIDYPTAARLRNAAIVGVKGDAAQHQVARLQVPVDDDALAARRPSTCHASVAPDVRRASRQIGPWQDRMWLALSLRFLARPHTMKFQVKEHLRAAHLRACRYSMPRAQSSAISTARRRLGHTLPSPTFTRLNLPTEGNSQIDWMQETEILGEELLPQFNPE